MKRYKIFENVNDAAPYWVGVLVVNSSGTPMFWQQISKNYVTYNGAKRWALKHNIQIENGN